LTLDNARRLVEDYADHYNYGPYCLTSLCA